jgi:hypothetical protein
MDSINERIRMALSDSSIDDCFFSLSECYEALEECRRRRIAILGIDSFSADGAVIRPELDYILDLSSLDDLPPDEALASSYAAAKAYLDCLSPATGFAFELVLRQR